MYVSMLHLTPIDLVAFIHSQTFVSALSFARAGAKAQPCATSLPARYRSLLLVKTCSAGLVTAVVLRRGCS